MSDSEYGTPSGSAFPPVLDACCGTRSFWFDRKDARAVFVDRRRETHEKGPYKSYPSGQHIIVDPDQIADFTALPFPSGIFDHVVFDPPHMVKIGDTSYTALKYGKLEGDWRDMLRQGFAECFRVLRPGGTLIFKWCEYDVPVSEVLALTPEKPLYGHRSGKQSKTHWIAFLKPNTYVQPSAMLRFVGEQWAGEDVPHA